MAEKNIEDFPFEIKDVEPELDAEMVSKFTGKACGWREYFHEEMARQAEHWISDHLRGTDLRPQHGQTITEMLRRFANLSMRHAETDTCLSMPNVNFLAAESELPPSEWHIS